MDLVDRRSKSGDAVVQSVDHRLCKLDDRRPCFEGSEQLFAFEPRVGCAQHRSKGHIGIQEYWENILSDFVRCGGFLREYVFSSMFSVRGTLCMCVCVYCFFVSCHVFA